MCFVCVAESNRANTTTSGHINAGSAEAISSFGYGSAAATAINTSQYLSAVLSGPSWSNSAGTAVTVSYSFDFSAADSSIVYSNNPYTLTSAEKAIVKSALSEISEVIDITFAEASSSSAAQIHFYNGDLSLGGNVVGVAGYYYDGSNIFTRATVGMDDTTAGYEKGTWKYVTLLHEIGHAIGLKHPGNYSGDEDGPFLPSNLDSTDYTVMSYNDGSDGDPTTLRELDVAALQSLYGGSGYYGDTETSSGTTGTASADTLSGSSSGDDIKAGLGSDVVAGGAGNDTLYGGRAIADADDSGDTIRGGTGDDLMYGNTGSDQLYGGESASSTGDGADTIYGGLGLDTIYGNEGSDFLAGGGGVAHPADDADTIYGGGGTDSIVGNGGGDVIYGDSTASASGDGADTVYGGLGNDTIYGGGGNDSLYGQTGDDVMYGDAGSDAFIFHSNGGVDDVIDFTSGEDILRIASNINSSGIDTAAEVIANFSVVDGWGFIALGSSSHGIWLANVTTLSASDVVIF